MCVGGVWYYRGLVLCFLILFFILIKGGICLNEICLFYMVVWDVVMELYNFFMLIFEEKVVFLECLKFVLWCSLEKVMGVMELVN